MSRQMQSTAKPQRKPASRRGDRRSRLARAGVGAVAAVLAGLMIFSLVYSVLPVSAAASQSSVNALRDELDEISAEKKEIEAELKDLTADKTALRAQITALDQQIAAAVEEIDVQTQLIDELSALITVKEGDQLIDANLTSGRADIIIAAREGKAIRFPEEKVRPIGRTGAGVRAITIEGDAQQLLNDPRVKKAYLGQ